MNIEQKDLYNKLVRIHGLDGQLGYFYEEIGELLQVINKKKRVEKTNERIYPIEKIYDELVDVSITLEIVMVGYKLTQKEYNEIKKIKLDRIKTYLGED